MCVSVQLEQLESEAQSDRESLRSAENLSSDLMKEKAQLQKTLETLRENSERQVRTDVRFSSQVVFHIQRVYTIYLVPITIAGRRLDERVRLFDFWVSKRLRLDFFANET